MDAGFTDRDTQRDNMGRKGRDPEGLPLSSPPLPCLPAPPLLGLWFSNRGDFPPPGNTSQSLETFLAFMTTDGLPLVIHLVKARDTVQHPAMHVAATTARKDRSGLNCPCVQVGKHYCTLKGTFISGTFV